MRPLGILILDTGFPRAVGDVGNPRSFDFPVLYERVAGATVARTVHQDPAPLLDAFVEAGLRLAAAGCVGITTTCGFLALFQRALAARLPVPVATSSLLQLASIEAMLPPGRRAGVVTYSAADLGPAHLAAVGARPDTAVRGLDPSGSFARMIRGEVPDLDAQAAAAETVAAARALVAGDPGIGAIVLECANLPPHAGAVRLATGLPVFDALGMIRWFRAAL
jgi:hypothetical protein